MLKKLKEQDFDRYVEFAYELASDMTKSGYPTYADNIKTKEDFIARSRKAFSTDNEEILIFERDGITAGWIHYFYLPEDRYLDTCAFCIASGMKEALDEFIAFAGEHFPGSDLYLGFPGENREAVAALEARNFDCIEESYNDAMDFENYEIQPEDKGILSVKRENYKLFSALHCQNDSDMYWNSARILDTIDRWQIYVCLREGKAAGAIYFMKDALMPEIFGVDFLNGAYDSGIYRALLTAALNDGKRSGARHMIFFNERKSQADAIACGLRCIGEYVCFKKTL
ncbi:MAG: hypothetical protein NC123_19565 [Butyrivibrio sp.]|nr:hypothetical protein [Acetatifactor muris]MCM1561708.1 hypothetical protein [Butyrivibrio sp.]